MGKGIIQARDLVKRFGELTAVDGISFVVREGECLGFLGPNGAGKTTTIRMIYALSPLTAGELYVADYDIRHHPRKIKGMIGVVPQENNLDPDLTVLENLLVYARYFEIHKQEAVRRAFELLDFLELREKKDRLIEELSAGMKRRLIIARALIQRPRILILDEPTTGLDPQARHLIWQRLRSLKREGVTQILTTHYMEEATQLCDRVAIMDQGMILRLGSPQELVAAEVGEEVIELQVGEDEEARIKGFLEGSPFIWEQAGDTLYLYCSNGREVLASLARYPHLRLVHRPATLEDLFLKLTGRRLRE